MLSEKNIYQRYFIKNVDSLDDYTLVNLTGIIISLKKKEKFIAFMRKKTKTIKEYFN